MANGVPLDDLLNNNEQLAAEIIVEWYVVHRQMGGEA